VTREWFDEKRRIETLPKGHRILKLPYKQIEYKPGENLKFSPAIREVERADLPDLKELLQVVDKAELDALREVLKDVLAAQNYRCRHCNMCKCGQSLEHHCTHDANGDPYEEHTPIAACESGSPWPSHVEQVMKLTRAAGFKRAHELVLQFLHTRNPMALYPDIYMLTDDGK
jgi:hypothetical protein